MKVAIVTQPLMANYGGILQNYALQQVLKQPQPKLRLPPILTGRPVP